VNMVHEASDDFCLPSPSISGTSSSELQDSPLGHFSHQKGFVLAPSLAAKSAEPLSEGRHANGELHTVGKSAWPIALAPSKPRRQLENHRIVCKPFTMPQTSERTGSPIRQNKTSSQEQENNRNLGEVATREGSPILRQRIEGSGLERALDFERRKKAAILSRRELIKQRQFSSRPENTVNSSNSPHLSRYLAARAALTSAASSSADTLDDSRAESATAGGLSPDDPRAYFIRCRHLDSQSQPSKAGLKIKRIQTSKLPLERIPDGQDVQTLALRRPVSLESLSESFKQLQGTDSYVRSGCDYEPFCVPNLNGISKVWETRLTILVRETYKSKKSRNGTPEIQIDLSTIFRSQFEPETEA
jgi:hypothetical protein